MRNKSPRIASAVAIIFMLYKYLDYMSNLVRIADAADTHVDFEELRAHLKDELCLIDGVYYCTIRGLSRLIGISAGCLTDNRKLGSGLPHGILQKLKVCTLAELPESLKPIAGFDYSSQPKRDEANINHMLPEVVVSCIIKYYAYDAKIKKPKALLLDNLFSSLGVRTFFSSVLSDDNNVALPGTYPEHSAEIAVSDKAIDIRAKAVVEALSVLADCPQDYKQKALLALLDVV